VPVNIPRADPISVGKVKWCLRCMQQHAPTLFPKSLHEYSVLQLVKALNRHLHSRKSAVLLFCTTGLWQTGQLV
jgi:hypothetical protein